MTKRNFIPMGFVALVPIWIALYAAILSMSAPDDLARLLGHISLYASGALIVLPIAWSVPAACLLAGLWQLISQRQSEGADQEHRRARLRLLSVGLIAWGALLVAQPLFRLRYAGASARATRLEPVVVALRSYRLAVGRYPDSLSELMPLYLREIPAPGALAYQEYEYVRIAARTGSGGYELIIPMWFGMSFDNFVYWPSEKYPDKMDPGGVVRLGRWAYVRD